MRIYFRLYEVGSQTILCLTLQQLGKKVCKTLGGAHYLPNDDTGTGNRRASTIGFEIIPFPTLCHLGNLAQKFGRTLNIDPANGRILGDDEAMAMWGREYERGWSPEF